MKRVLIAAGHSDSDPGAVQNGVTEESLMQELRNLIVRYLIDSGKVEVVMDGTNDINLPLKNSIQLLKNCDLGIELHANSHTTSTASGVEVISLPKHKTLSQKIAKAIASITGDKLRGDSGWIDQTQSKRGKLGFVEGGGILPEVLFESNPQSLQRYIEKKDDVARAIANTILENV